MNIRFDFDVLNLVFLITPFTFEESTGRGNASQGVCGLKVSLDFQKLSRVEVGQICSRKLGCVILEPILQIIVQATISKS